MEKIKLDFNDALEGLVNIADYLLALDGEKNIPFCEDIEPLEGADKNIISEIQIELNRIALDIINNILKMKGILKYTDDCDFEEKQEWAEEIIEKGSRGYDKILKKAKEEHMQFGTCNAIVQYDESDAELLHKYHAAPDKIKKAIKELLS